jgi:hypothetical protein
VDRSERDLTPSASYSLTLRLRIPRLPGSFARVAAAVFHPHRSEAVAAAVAEAALRTGVARKHRSPA